MATTNTANIQKLYVAYFNRPADSAGLAYWEGIVATAKGDTTAVSAAFAAEAEYKTAYAGMNNAQIVNQVYLNLFGRSAEAGGVAYWSDLLDKKAITIDKVVTQIAAGAQGTDAEAYENKVIAAQAFTEALDTPAEQAGYRGDGIAAAKAFMAGITTDASLTAALQPINLSIAVAKVVAAGTPFTLTSGLQALETATATKASFLDAADGKADGVTTLTDAAITAKVDTAVANVGKIVAGYDTTTSAGVRAALLADKVAANAAALTAAQKEVADDNVAIAKVTGLSAALATQTSADAAAKAAATAELNAQAEVNAKATAFNTLNSSTITVNANGTVTDLIKLDGTGKLVLENSTVTEAKYPGITALLAATTANEAAEAQLVAATKAAATAKAAVDFLDQSDAEVAQLKVVAAAMTNVELEEGELPTAAQIATEQAILTAKAEADPSNTAAATAKAEFDAKVSAFWTAAAVNPLDAELKADTAAVTSATANIKALTDAVTAMNAANETAAQLKAVNASIAAANKAFIDHDMSLPVEAEGTMIASAGSDIYVASDTDATIALFGLQGNDSLFIGTEFTRNTGDFTKAGTGNNSVLEVFFVQEGNNTKVIMETSAFGSNASTPEVVTITLTGVAVVDVHLSNGIITVG